MELTTANMEFAGRAAREFGARRARSRPQHRGQRRLSRVLGNRDAYAAALVAIAAVVAVIVILSVVTRLRHRVRLLARLFGQFVNAALVAMHFRAHLSALGFIHLPVLSLHAYRL